MRKVLLAMWALGASGAWAQEAEESSSTEVGDSETSLESEAPTKENPTSDEREPEAVLVDTESDSAKQAEADELEDSEPTESAETDDNGGRVDEATIGPIDAVESLDDAPPPPISEAPQGPEDLVIDYEEVDPDAADLSRAMLLDYCLKSKTVVVGRVLTSRVEVGVLDELVELRVEEILRGEPPPVITARVPIPEPDGGFIDGNVEQSARVIPGYLLLLFLDPSGTVVNGDAVFFTESGFAFRNKRADNFLRPRSDRDWIENVDPSVDYYVYTIQSVKDALEANPMDYKKLKGDENGKKKRKWFCPFRRDK